MTTARAEPRRAPPAWAATLVLAGYWLAVGPATPDLAAQMHRAGLFAAHGFAVWDNSWYDGHHVPGYSLVFPALGSIVGVRAAGAAAAVLSAALFQSLVGGRRAQAACWWFAIGCVADLLVGRLTYALGVTAGLAAVAALRHGRPAVAAAVAATCAATSPVAGLLLALTAAGIALAERRTRALVMGAAAVATALALSVAFPEGGTQPFPPAAFAETFAILLAAALLVGAEVRPALLAYGAAVVGCFVVASPMGANVTRLGTAFLAPALLVAPRPAARARRILLVGTLVAVAAWQWVDPVTQAARGWGDPSTAAAYYRPLIAQLRRRDAGSARIEVPFTRDHWETVYLARDYALARGWERQLDRRLNPLFYGRRLDPAALDRWLRANAVRYVALTDAPMDPAGRAEARIVAAAPPFLREVWRGRHWRLFRVRDPLPLASGSAHPVHLGATDLRLRVRRPGPILVRVHWTPYWRLADGSGCIGHRGPWTVLLAGRPGTFVMSARFSLARVPRRGPACRPPRRDAAPAPDGPALRSGAAHVGPRAWARFGNVP